MTPDDAAATGALPGDVGQDDLRPEPTPEPRHRAVAFTDDVVVPGGATDAIWYLAAVSSCPPMESTRKRGWIEGYVAGLEAARGVDAEAVGEVLRHSIGLEVEVPVAIREPSPHKADAESLARFMFERQAVTFEAEEETMDSAWDDPGVHEFWLSEAEAVLRFLP